MTKVKGSEWRKWDLHFHTPSSYDYSDKSITNQQIIDGLSSNGISVVAITDHHVIDTARISELQILGREKNITVLPGIEFLSDARGAEPIHFIGIFSESADIQFISKQIESRTKISQIQGQGKKINEVYCDLIDTIKIIKEFGGIVTIHAGQKSNSVENITHSLPHGTAQKIDIAEAIDIFEIGQEIDCEGYAKTVIPFLKQKIGKHIPLVICSDNHCISDYKTKQNLWIKADPTFEGLKQILFESEQRVKIQKEEPDYKEDKLVIEEIRFISPNNKFTSRPIYLNKNLNVIIGGKSSGKSILLYNIAKTLIADNEFLKKEHIENKYDFKVNDPDFNFEIKTQGGFSQSMYRDISENSVIPEIKYIPQNYLIKLAEPDENRTGAALNKIIRDLINEDPKSQQSYSEFVSLVKSNDRKRETIIDNYFSIKEKIASLEGQLKMKMNKEILEKNIESNSSKVQELNKSSGMTTEQIKLYNDLQKQLDDNKLERTKALNDFKKIGDFNKEARETLTSLVTKKNLLSSSLENEEIKKHFNSEYLKLDNLINQLESYISAFELVKTEAGTNTFKIESLVSNIFATLTSSKKKIEDNLLPFLKNEEIKRQIEAILKSISDDKTSLQSIAQLSKEITENKTALEEEKIKLFNLYDENYNHYLKIIDTLNCEQSI